MAMQPAAEDQGDLVEVVLPPAKRVLTHIGPFDFNAMVDSLHVEQVEDKEGKKTWAFRVDLVAILPEKMAAALMGMVKDGRVKVRLEPPAEV